MRLAPTTVFVSRRAKIFIVIASEAGESVKVKCYGDMLIAIASSRGVEIDCILVETAIHRLSCLNRTALPRLYIVFWCYVSVDIAQI
ncbi:hypothetical protein [Nostoc sp.]|uniref:hypothetical protein n=1 Tax=Nostoc sp. TaxID=1180 RepID=UPI002FFA935E